MCPQLPLVSVHAHTHALGRHWCDKLDKNLEKNSHPPIIREKKSSLFFAASFQSQMCQQLPIVGVHAHICPQGSSWCDKPDKKLEKNLDSPIKSSLENFSGNIHS